MNTIRELKQQEKYKNMLKRKNKEKNIYKDKNSTLRIEKMNLIKCIERKDKEIERLNNIIKELEKWLNEKICLNKNDKDYINGMTFVGVNLQMYQMFLDKLQELKGSE